MISTPCKHCQCLLCTDAVQGVCRCLVTSDSVLFPEDYLGIVTVRWMSLSVMLFSATCVNIVWHSVGCGHLPVTERVEVHMQDTGRKEFTGEHIGHVVCTLVTVCCADFSTGSLAHEKRVVWVLHPKKNCLGVQCGWHPVGFFCVPDCFFVFCFVLFWGGSGFPLSSSLHH